MNDICIRMIEIVAHGLGDLNDYVAFVGGAAAGLYVDDLASDDARPTTDVDCVMQLRAMNGLYNLEETLQSRHFRHDIESGIICRWTYQGITVDIMPDDERILGFSNRWYTKGMDNRIDYVLPNNETIHIFPAPFYLATKLEAIASRGGCDLRLSHDFEDFVFVLNGRTNIVSELQNISDHELRTYLSDKFQELRDNPNIEECITCVLPIGEEERYEYIISILEAINT